MPVIGSLGEEGNRRRFDTVGSNLFELLVKPAAENDYNIVYNMDTRLRATLGRLCWSSTVDAS